VTRAWIVLETAGVGEDGKGHIKNVSGEREKKNVSRKRKA
jgi:hypothetical protein